MLSAILAAALGIRLLFVVLVLPLLDARLGLGYAASNYDADGYGVIADSILHGQYTDVQRAPVYPALVALVYALFRHSNAAVKIAQAVVDTGTVAVIWMLGNRAAPGTRTGRVAAILYALYPLAWWRCGFVDKEVLETFALALFVWSVRAVGPKRQVGSGLLLGLANLIKPILLGTPLVMAVWLWRQRKRVRNPGRQWLALVGGLLAVVTPWTVRNYVVTKHLVPVALENGGMTAFVGNYGPSLGAWEGPHKAEWQAEVAHIAATKPNASLVELDRAYLRAAAAEVVAQPGTFAEMLALKIWRFWFANASGRLGALVFAIQLVVLGLATVGLWRSELSRDSKLLPALLIAYLWLVHAVIYAEVRFSLPAAPYMMLFAAAGASALWTSLPAGKSQRP